MKFQKYVERSNLHAGDVLHHDIRTSDKAMQF